MNELDIFSATELAKDYISNAGKEIGVELVLLTDSTIYGSLGWLFFYNSVDFIETGKDEFALAGNGPIQVLKTGEIKGISSAVSIEIAAKSIS
jgi:hypothetical protein